jgi:hypothetical protein
MYSLESNLGCYPDLVVQGLEGTGDLELVAARPDVRLPVPVRHPQRVPLQLDPLQSETQIISRLAQKKKMFSKTGV